MNYLRKVWEAVLGALHWVPKGQYIPSERKKHPLLQSKKRCRHINLGALHMDVPVKIIRTTNKKGGLLDLEQWSI